MARRSGRSGRRAAPADPFQESDEDEDFAAPPKKARPAEKRVPLGEKLFQRDLEVTLALSLNEYLGKKDKIQEKDDRAEPKAAVEDFKQETLLCTPETDNDENLCANQENSQPPLEIELGSSESVGKPLKTSSPSVPKKPSWTPPVTKKEEPAQREKEGMKNTDKVPLEAKTARWEELPSNHQFTVSGLASPGLPK